MLTYNKAELGRVAQQYGFVRDTFEKVLRLKEVLRYLNEEEFLKEHLLLKGGTAINLSFSKTETLPSNREVAQPHLFLYNRLIS